MKLSERDAQVVGAWFGKLSKNICPHCDAVIAQQNQVGHCVYARPCGHRLYQGDVGAFAPNPGNAVELGGAGVRETGDQ